MTRKRGYWIISSYRESVAGLPPEPFVEMERKWFRWKWMAKLSLHPRMFVVKLREGRFAMIKTDLVPADQDIKDS